MESSDDNLKQIRYDIAEILTKLNEKNDVDGFDAQNIDEILKISLLNNISPYLEKIQKLTQDALEKNEHRVDNRAHHKPLSFFSKDVLKKFTLVLSGAFLGGIIVSFLGGYLALKPLQDKITEHHTMGMMLEKAWPKLTEKERNRMKALF